MVQIHPQLSLDLNPTHIPKPISAFLDELTTIGDVSERVSKLDDFIKRIEDESRKIEAFKRELPICMLLLTDAIVSMKEISTLCRARNVEPVLEEFIPMKKSCDEDEKSDVRKEKDSRDKKNWMSSVQLWNCDSTMDSTMDSCDRKRNSENKQKAEEDNKKKVIDDPFRSSKSKSGGNGFKPLNGYSIFPATAISKEDKVEFPAGGLSLVTPGTKNPKEELGSTGLSSKTNVSKTNCSSTPNGQLNLRSEPQPPPQQQTSRKQRRCWSPELHRRFVNALQQLGGSQAATPKQIRELMQVDGLTNDEVKSHLQKYRLHTRRVPGSTSATADQSMAVLGGLWGPQDECGESSKTSNSQSGSPQGPLQLNCGGTSTTGGDFNEEEDDDKSESYSWKSHHVHKSEKDDRV